MTFDFDAVLEGAKRIHFIGIGGSGMCPLAEILLAEGKLIHGSDVDDKSDTVNRIRSMGVEVLIGHRAENVGDVDLVVYTAAIQKDNPELLSAIERGIPTVERSILLGAVCRRYPRTIAVCGTHGKTTVTSMISQILISGGFDPSVIIGGKLPSLGANGKAGSSDVMVCEACEFVDTFLQITPAVAVVLNIDEDHLEYFKSLDNIIRSFNKFTTQTSELIIINGDDANSMRAIEGTDKRVITFGLGEGNDYRAVGLAPDEDSHWHFDIIAYGEQLCHVELLVPGEHNVLNALAAAAAAGYAGANGEQIAAGLGVFTGAARRFEVHTTAGGITVADDYAHHPAELEATLSACRQMHYKRVWAVFQPFTYSRTRDHLEEFGEVLKLADKAIITPIMAAREIDDLGVSSEQLQALVPGCMLMQTFEEIADYVTENACEGDLVITMGCGDVYKCAKLMKAALEKKYS